MIRMRVPSAASYLNACVDAWAIHNLVGEDGRSITSSERIAKLRQWVIICVSGTQHSEATNYLVGKDGAVAQWVIVRRCLRQIPSVCEFVCGGVLRSSVWGKILACATQSYAE